MKLYLFSIFFFTFFLNVKLTSSLDLLHPNPNENSENELQNINHSEIKARSLQQNEYEIGKIGRKSTDSDISDDDPTILAVRHALSLIRTPDCKKDFNATVIGLQQRKPWAIAMYDATVKVPTGIEYGDVYQFGNFDQCMTVSDIAKNDEYEEDENDVDGTSFLNEEFHMKQKYCLAEVTIDGYVVRTQATRHFEKRNSTLVHWGVCIPETCSSNDVARILTALTGHKNVSVTSQMCHLNKPPIYTVYDIIYGCVIVSFISMVLFCTCYKVCMMRSQSDIIKDHPKSSFDMFVTSFSLTDNLQKLVKKSRDDLGLSCVNGIKAISMMLIVSGHALLFISSGPVLNSNFIAEQVKLFRNAILLNSPLLVDTFLLLSGFLFARLLLVELDKRSGKINFLLLYIFRYIRLTPAYLAVIALYATWMPKLGSGPLWDQRMNLEQERCKSSWWLNLLYINNYIGNDKLCMFQSWYLAADTQLFILAPLVLYPIWKFRNYGLSILSILMAFSIVVPFVLTYAHELDPTFLAFSDEIKDISANKFFKETYVKTHMRGTSYLFGLFTGYYLYFLQSKNIKFRRSTVFICWLFTAVVGIASMFSITIFFEKSYSTLQNAMYAGLHRFGWSIACSWILLACALDRAGPLKNFLSSRAFVPLSRLTYCAYLTNGFVELYIAATMRSPRYMSTTNLFVETLGHIGLTFASAILLCLIFESPIHGIEKIFLRKDHLKQEMHQRTSQTSSTIAINSEGSA